jgi:hypothetical protein
MRINNFSESPELSAMRETLFYTELRPYVRARLAANTFIEDLRIREENEAYLSVEDRYFATLDILFGQLFKNCKTRQVWKQMLIKLRDEEAVSCLQMETLDKAYQNELVVLFERLGRFVSLLRKAFGANFDVVDLELRLLVFFNPLLFTKRNYSHHRLYVGFRGMTELQSLEEKVTDERSFDVYYGEFEARLTERLEWISYTERALTGLYKDFLDLVHSKIRRDGVYLAPICLAHNFSILDRLNVRIREDYDHERVFAEHASNKA